MTNFYPPVYVGGYELRCRDVVDGLRARGHTVKVITSMEGRKTAGSQTEVVRGLPLRWMSLRTENGFIAQLRDEWTACRLLARELREFAPELLSIWNMHGLSDALLTTAKRSGVPFTFHIDDEWMLWRDPWFSAWLDYDRWWIRALKRTAVRWVDHRGGRDIVADWTNRCAFISRFRRDEYARVGKPVRSSPVIYGGVPACFFGRKYEEFGPGRPPRRLLFSGVLAPRKAPHIAIEALARILREGYPDVRLTIAGSSRNHPEYRTELESLVRTRKLDCQIEFREAVPREQMPRLYAEHDILLFTSTDSEGLPLTILESMAGGLVVVGSMSGGQVEILHEGRNSLTFVPGDIPTLTEQTRKLLDNPTLARQLGEAATRMVREEYTVERMVAQHEAFFLATARTRNRRQL